MGFAVRRGFNPQDSAAVVRSILPEWKTGKNDTAAKSKESLYKHIKKKLPGYPLKKAASPAKGQPKADLLVAHDLAVLVETGVTTKKRLLTVLERLETFRVWEGKVLVILTGLVDEEMRARIDDWANAMNNDREFVSEREIIITRF